MAEASSTEKKSYRAIGLMSGTSMDGIDVAMITTNGKQVLEFGPSDTVEYNAAMRKKIAQARQGKGDVLALEHELTLAHVDAVNGFCQQHDIDPASVDVIGFHGQTVSHRPGEGITQQIGDGSLLAEKTGIDVVCDMRRRDVAAGGQGAPLVPLYHAALAYDALEPVAFINIGGISNITYISPGKPDGIIAFDCGPGNCLIDRWVSKQGDKPYDEGGELALAGTMDVDLVKKMMRHESIASKPPKSTDPADFDLKPLAKLSLEDGAATLAALTAGAIIFQRKWLTSLPARWYITGGGRHNQAIMRGLKAQLAPSIVEPVELHGWDGDAMEAQAFAFLAVRSLLGLPLTLPSTTGVSRAVTGGAFYRA